MPTKRKIFLDVGGHFGETLEEVLKPKYGFDLVHCFEPIPDCYARIKSVFASEISAGKLQVHNFGLSNRTDNHGELVVRTTGEQGSGILHSMSEANCYIVLPTDSHGAAAGDVVEVEPFEGMLMRR